MSKANKVSPTQYHVGGRLTPDDLARERVKQRNVNPAAATSPAKSSIPTRAPGSRDRGAAQAPTAGEAKPRTRSAGRSRG